MMENLEHYGVKGMRWGKRRAAKKATKRASKKAAITSRKTTADWNKQYSYRSKLSDSDLQRAVNRLRLENELGAQLNKSRQYVPKNKAQKTGEVIMDLVKGSTGAVAGTAAFTKNLNNIGSNTIATYRNTNTMMNLDKIKYQHK